MSPSLAILVFVVLLPAVVSATVLGIGLALPRRGEGGPRTWVGALAVGAGYTTGHLLRHGFSFKSDWKLIDAWQWAFVAGVGATLIALPHIWRKWPASASWLLRAGVVVGVVLLTVLLQPFMEEVWETGRGWTLLVVLAGGASLWWLGLASVVRWAVPRTGLAHLILAATGLSVVLVLSNSVRLAEMCGLVCAATGPAMLAAFRPGWTPTARGATWVAPVILFGVVLTGYYFIEAPLRPLVVIGLAPLAAFVVRLPYLARLRGWQRGVMGLIVVLVPIVIEVTLAIRAYEPDPYGGY